MIIDKLNQQIEDFKSISKRNSAINNAAKQMSIDEKFKDLILDTKKRFEIIKYCSAEFGFNVKCVDQLKNLLESLNDCIFDSFVDEEMYKKAEKNLKNVENQIKQEWECFFGEKTGLIQNILKTIVNINKFNVERSLSDICAAEKWESDIKKYQQMKKGLDDAQNLIDNLNLNNNDVVVFLKKISKKQATITDLTPEIIDWIYKENLEKKIKIVI